jgi:hypothetical protein
MVFIWIGKNFINWKSCTNPGCHHCLDTGIDNIHFTDIGLFILQATIIFIYLRAAYFEGPSRSWDGLISLVLSANKIIKGIPSDGKNFMNWKSFKDSGCHHSLGTSNGLFILQASIYLLSEEQLSFR